MGSFKRNGQDHGAGRRRKGNGTVRREPLNFESLEGRTLLSTGTTQPTAISVGNIQSGPMANEGQILISVYEAYLKGDSPSQLAGAYPLLQFQGNAVAVTVKATGTGDFNTFVSSLTNLGFQVGTPSTEYNLVEGSAGRVAALDALLPQVRNVAPIEKPVVGFVGAADNEGETALQADIARTANNVDGTGQTVGALSDSVSQVGGGLADSVKTGDLPNTVKVIQDGPAGSTDEGRAMLEDIHDIAPGAALQFATADGGQVGFANNILALAAAGSTVITDDVTYFDEPFFQDGAIAQAVNTVVGQNIPYLSSAGNTGRPGLPVQLPRGEGDDRRDRDRHLHEFRPDRQYGHHRVADHRRLGRPEHGDGPDRAPVRPAVQHLRDGRGARPDVGGGLLPPRQQRATSPSLVDEQQRHDRRSRSRTSTSRPPAITPS